MVEFEVRISPLGGELVCKVPNKAKSTNNQEFERSFVRFRCDLACHRARLCLPQGAPAYLAQLDLSEQFFGDRAARALVEALLFGTVRCPQMFLYKCQLGDAGAQALARYVEQTPKPGVQGLGLSHNFFSPIGVKLIIEAAHRSKLYPIRRDRSKGVAPLWLRLDHQLISWKGFTGYSEIEQLMEAEKRVEELSARLLAKSQAEGLIPSNLKPWELPRMICIPAARGPDQVPDPMDDGIRRVQQEASKCALHCCKFISQYGPIIHLPFFWMQDGGRPSAPEAASVSTSEASWKTWAPRVPYRNAAAREAAVASAKVSLVEAAARQEAAAQEAAARMAAAAEAAAEEAAARQSEQSDADNPNEPLLPTVSPSPQKAAAAKPAAAPQAMPPRRRKSAKYDALLKGSSALLELASSPVARSPGKHRKSSKEVKVENGTSVSSTWVLSGRSRPGEIDLEDEVNGEAASRIAALEEQARRNAAFKKAEADLHATEVSLAAEHAAAEARMKEAMAAFGEADNRKARGKAGARSERSSSDAAASASKRQRREPQAANSAPPFPDPASSGKNELKAEEPAIEELAPEPAIEEPTPVEMEDESLEEIEEELQEDEDEELDLID